MRAGRKVVAADWSGADVGTVKPNRAEEEDGIDDEQSAQDLRRCRVSAAGELELTFLRLVANRIEGVAVAAGPDGAETDRHRHRLGTVDGNGGQAFDELDGATLEQLR